MGSKSSLGGAGFARGDRARAGDPRPWSGRDRDLDRLPQGLRPRPSDSPSFDSDEITIDIPGDGNAWFLSTLPGSGSSSLARDGVVMFAMLHRALTEGARSLGKAQQRDASATALGSGDLSAWKRHGQPLLSSEQPLRAGIVENGDRLVALNRPLREDHPETLGKTAIAELFAGLDYHVIEDQVENDASLASEIWRTFLIVMALALLGEALLCMPPRRDPKTSPAR